MSSQNLKHRLMIVTTDLEHATIHRIHFFLPTLSKKFDVTIININHKYLRYLNSERRTLKNTFVEFANFFLTFGKVLIDRLQSKDNIYTIEIPDVPGSIFLSLVAVPILIRNITKRYSFSVIWGVAPFAGFSILMSKVNVPFVYDDTDRYYLFYSTPLMKIMKKIMKIVEETCILRSRVVTAAGILLYKSGQKIRGSNKSIIFLPNAVDLRESSRVDQNTKRYDLVYVGIVGEWCGLNTVLEALGRTVSSIPDFNFLIVGPVDRGYYNLLQQIMLKFHLTGKVKFVGRVNHAEVLRYLSQSKIGVAVYPNTDLMKHAFTIKLLEYMAAKLAVIASDVGDTAEIVRSANCGVVVDPNPEKISEVIIRLLHDSELRQRYGENGRKYVMQNYNVEIVSKRLITLLEKLSSNQTS